MNNLFYTVLNMSITSSIIIALVIIIRLFFKNLPKKYSYILWSVVGFRLCVPYSFKSIISLFNIGSAITGNPIKTDNNRLSYVDKASIIPQNIGASSTVSNTDTITLSAVLPYIWLGIVIIILAVSIIKYIKCKNTLKDSESLSDSIYYSDKISTPFIFGIITPIIYIPKGTDSAYLEYIIAHEKYHLKRKDYIIKAFAYLLLCIHFFNPLCYVAFKLMNRDMEMSCDEKVIESFKSIKKEYSTALLKFATDNYKASPSPLCFIENDAKSRIKNILKFKKPKKAVSIIAIILCLTVLSACVSNPVDVKKQTDKISINTNISSTQSDNFSDDYILGKVIFESPLLSSILIDGGNTTIKFDGKKLIRSDESEQTKYSDKIEKQEYTKKQFSEKYTNQSNTPKTVIDKKYIKSAKLIKEVKYYKGENFVSIIYFDNKPALYISDGIRAYEIMPNSKGFGNAVSNEILKHISPNSDYDKYKSEAHYIYKKEYTGNDTISVYLNFYAATYSARYSYLKDESAWINDARIDLKLNNNSGYDVVKFTAAQDGDEYNKSIKEMFSNDVYAYYFGDNSNNKDGFSDELKKHAIKSLVENNKDIDINKSIETLIKRIGNINSIDTEYNEYFNLLIDYDEYTVRYTFNKYKSKKLGEPEGKILQSAFSKIAEDEYVKASANTGKEYFGAFDKHARDLKKQNKLDYDFKLQYPYTYLYLTEYAK